MKKFIESWKRKEMSKRLLIVILGIVILLFPVSIIVSCVVGDATPMREYIIGAFSLVSIAVGFYFWKAKNENLHKYATKYSDAEKEIIEKLNDAIGGVDDGTV